MVFTGQFSDEKLGGSKFVYSLRLRLFWADLVSFPTLPLWDIVYFCIYSIAYV